MKNTRVWSILAGMFLLWIAVGAVLVFDHNIQQSNPSLTPAQRQAHADGLYAIAGVFLLFNGAMTALRLRMARKANADDRVPGR